MKQILIIAALLGASVLSLATPLTSRDYAAPGDGLLTYDPVSGLEWLDVNTVTGQSFDQVQSGPWYQAGFTHASTEQIFAFYADAGIADEEWVTSSRAELIAIPGVQDALAYFDMTSSVDASLNGGAFQLAMSGTTYNAAPIPVNYLRYGNLRLLFRSRPDETWACSVSVHDRWFGKSVLEDALFDGGNYLVRAAVPEGGLPALGLAMLFGGLVWRRKI